MENDYRDWSKQDLYELATDMDIEGRSSMSKPQLLQAILDAEGPDGPPSTPESSADSDESPSPVLLARLEVEAAREELRAARQSLRAATSGSLQSGNPGRVPEAEVRLAAAVQRYVKATA